jgi:hypothetical protein
MPDSTTLRELCSHRVLFEYENGARIEGTIGATRPGKGPVQLVLLSAVLLRGSHGRVVAKRDELLLVPNVLVNIQRGAEPVAQGVWRRADGGIDPAEALEAGRVSYEFDTGAKIVGTPVEDELGGTGLQTLADVVLSDSNGRTMERASRLCLVPRPLLGFRLAEGPGGF